jgi:RNA polymerase sigma-70 factor (ECF subfamily)
MNSPASRLREAPASDGVLVERIKGGDEGAFRELYLRYARFVAGIAYSLLGDNAEVEDVVQETFVALDAGVHKVREPEHVKSWLAIVATRVVRKRLVKRGRRRGLSQAVQAIAQGHTRPQDEERLQALYRALERLPPRLRIPWTTHRVGGVTLPETAERCRVSLATVKRRVASAEVKLRRQLGEEWL